MEQEVNMLHGDIKKTLLNLAWPIVLTNLIQTALGIVDMIWIGRLGSGAVTAIGTANIFISFANSLAFLAITGTGVKVAQAIGKGHQDKSKSYVKTGMSMSVAIAALYIVIVGLFKNNFIQFFNIESQSITQLALDYLTHSLYGIPFLFIVGTYINILTSYGSTKLIFKANSIGLVTNIILDPIMIFGFKGIPAMGVIGAAWATNIARFVIFLILVYNTRSQLRESFKQSITFTQVKEIVSLGIPVAAQSFMFNFISMFMARLVVSYGTDVMAAQRIGIQIESVTYITIGGLQGAIAAFVGQNYGNDNIDRVQEAYYTAIKLVIGFGLIVTAIFLLFSDQLFSIFINEPNVIKEGSLYMQAIAFSQVFMGIEIISVGAFHGVGKTNIPSSVSTVLTVIRIPLAMILSKYLGVKGIWWSISISSILKGITMTTWFHNYIKKLKKTMSYELT